VRLPALFLLFLSVVNKVQFQQCAARAIKDYLLQRKGKVVFGVWEMEESSKGYMAV
jgi:hypothetical protein